jgi:hypothetical protein
MVFSKRVCVLPLLLPLVAGQSRGGAVSSTSGGKVAPRHAVLLRWGGMLSVLDLSRGAELMLADEVRWQAHVQSNRNVTTMQQKRCTVAVTVISIYVEGPVRGRASGLATDQHDLLPPTETTTRCADCVRVCVFPCAH